MKNRVIVFLLLIGFAFVLGFRKKIFSSTHISGPTPATVNQQEAAPTSDTSHYLSPMIGAIQPQPSGAAKPLKPPPINNNNPQANMSPYLSPFYVPPDRAQNSDKSKDKNPSNPAYHRNLYFETLAKQMEEMQKEQEKEAEEGEDGPPTPPPPAQINEPPVVVTEPEETEEENITDDPNDGENDVIQ